MTVAELKQLAESTPRDNYIVSLDPTVVLALCDVAEAGQKVSNLTYTVSYRVGAVSELRAALAALDETLK